jgi:uncharacterized Zn-binding protein involved in type VI secretion
MGDAWDIHSAASSHGGNAIAGSPTVFANGINIVRQGDHATCMHPISGSFNVFSG